MVADYHTHTALCKHGEGSVMDYVRRGVVVGLDEIGCSEHIPLPHDFDLVHRMRLDQFSREYMPQVLDARERANSQIKIRFGIEAEYYAGTEEWVRGFIAEHDFDYVIGAVHFLGQWGFDDPVFVHRYEERDIDRIYEEFFETVKRSASSGLFDIIAHCDLVKKFGHRPGKDFTDQIRDMLEIVKKHDLCIEVNTSGLRKPVKEIYPSEHILSVARDLRLPMTLGSDAHSPEDVGRDFNAAVDLIERYGGGKLAVFEKRERRLVPISRLR